MIRLTITLLLAFSSPIAMAVNWVAVEKSDDGRRMVALDLDSVRVRPDSRIEVTWYEGRMVVTPSDEVEAVLDCEAISINNRVMRFRDFAGRTTTNDLSKPSTAIVGPDSNRALYWMYPNWGHTQILRYVCPRFNPGWEGKWVAPLPVSACQSAKTFYETRLCSGNADALGEHNLLAHRLDQLQESCSIKEETKEKIRRFFFDLKNQCKDESCLGIVSSMDVFSPIEKSLRASKYGEKCTFVDEQQARMDRVARKEKALADAGAYLVCGAGAIPLLDDGVSSAETVASAISAKCKPVLDAALAQSEETVRLSDAIALNLRPQLVTFILQYRAAKRQAPGGQKNSPQSKPDRPKTFDM